jgi:hypothetical protein
VGGELDKICYEILGLLSERLIKDVDKSSDDEAKVFYKKMKGDYYRYICEYKTGVQ